MPRKFGGGNGPAVDLESLLDGSTLEALRDLVGLGALVSFGTSRDGGALSVHVRAGDIREREWFRLDEDLHEWLWDAVAVVRGEGGLGPSHVRPLRGA